MKYQVGDRVEMNPIGTMTRRTVGTVAQVVPGERILIVWDHGQPGRPMIYWDSDWSIRRIDREER